MLDIPFRYSHILPHLKNSLFAGAFLTGNISRKSLHCRGPFVGRFIDEANRLQGALLPETIDDYVSEENPVRVIDAFVAARDLGALGFEGVEPEATGRPAYHPATMLKIYLHGYLNRVQSTRRLEQEARRNLEFMC
jgi:hypothetical protein